MECNPHQRALPLDRYASTAAAESRALRVLARSACVAAASCALLVGTALPAFAADMTVYRCRDTERQVMYTDSPCPGGDRVALRPGKADPEAVKRLALARAELDRSAAQRREARIAEEARASELEQMRRLMQDRDREDSSNLEATTYYPAGWYSPYDDVTRLRNPRFSHPRFHNRAGTAHSRPAPNPPFPVPRR